MTTLPRVLIVEDDAAIRGMLTAALGREPLAVDTAVDGVHALEKLAGVTYAVIVVDLMMPRMDGYAFLEAFRDLALPVRPLVFVMSAYDDAGMLKFDGNLVHGSFKKPFDIDTVVPLIRDAAHALHVEPPAAVETETPSAGDVVVDRGVC